MEPDVHEICLKRSDSVPRLVREWLTDIARDLVPGLRRDLELLTHELVTNALRHTRTDHVWVTVLTLPDGVRVQVTNEGREGAPHVREPVAYSSSGRGLRWVDAFSRRWGVKRRNATGVWFQLGLPQQDRRSERPVSSS